MYITVQCPRPSSVVPRGRGETDPRRLKSCQGRALLFSLHQTCRASSHITRKSPFRGDWIIVICSPEIGANHATVAFVHCCDGFPIRQCLTSHRVYGQRFVCSASTRFRREAAKEHSVPHRLILTTLREWSSAWRISRDITPSHITHHSVSAAEGNITERYDVMLYQ